MTTNAGGAAGAPATPPLPAGFALRPYRGAGDHPGMARALTAVRLADGSRDAATAEGFDRHYPNLHGDLTLDCIVVERDGETVGYARVDREVQIDGTYRTQLFVVLEPTVRGLGLESPIVADRLRRAWAVVLEVAPTAGTSIEGSCQGSHPELHAALAAAGFRLAAEGANLIRPGLDAIPDVPLPPGFDLRAIEPDDLAMARRIYEADKRAFADTPGEPAPSETGFRDTIEAPSWQPQLFQVAFHGDDIAGQVLAYLAPPEADGTITGMTEAISVQAEFRRRGLARALLVSAMHAVKAAGAVRAGLGVDLQNPNQALNLYQELGFRITGRELGLDLGRWEAGAAPTLPAPAQEVVA